MKRMLRALLCLAAALLLLCLAGCGEDKTLEERGYTISVVYDYNGGTADGLPQLKMYYKPDQPLLAPGDTAEFKEPTLDRYHSLLGWYLARTDGEGNVIKDENGQPQTEVAPFVFAGARANNNITLVAKWKEKPTLEIHIPGSDTVSEPFEAGTTVENTLLSRLLPTLSDKTFYGFFADEACTERLTLPLTVGDGEHKNIYTRWLDGDVLIVRTASDLTKLRLYAAKTVWFDADIDMTGATFPSLSAFGGKIIGNGHTLRNLTVTASLTGRNTDWGLFGKLTDGAGIRDLNFENVSVTVDASYSFMNTFRVAFLASSATGKVTVENINFTGCSLTLHLPENEGTINDIASDKNYTGIIGTITEGTDLTYSASGTVQTGR